MAGIRKPKTGRRAPKGGVDRTMARQWVDLYRQAEQSPGGRYCLNPDDEPEIQTWIDATDPIPLLALLENFSEHGTFEHVGELFDSIRLLILRHEFREERRAGETYESTVKKLADKYKLEARTIERKVAPTKRDTD